VPFELPRSRSRTTPPSTRSSAWKRDTVASLKTQSAEGCTPSTVRSLRATNDLPASGPFSMNGVRRVLRTVRTPSQPAARAAKPKTDKPAVDASNPAAASQKYYMAIGEMIDELKPANELGETARWLIRDAKRIDALPILGVDPELVAWGGHVSMSLRDLASIQATGQRQTRAQTSQQNAPMPALVYDTWGGDDTGAAASAQTKADWNNYNRQRRAAAESVKVTITEQSSGILKELLQSRNAIRVAMTQKHNVEF